MVFQIWPVMGKSPVLKICCPLLQKIKSSFYCNTHLFASTVTSRLTALWSTGGPLPGWTMPTIVQTNSCDPRPSATIIKLSWSNIRKLQETAPRGTILCGVEDWPPPENDWSPWSHLTVLKFPVTKRMCPKKNSRGGAIGGWDGAVKQWVDLR